MNLFKYIDKILLGSVTVLIGMLYALLLKVTDTNQLVPMWFIYIIFVVFYLTVVFIYAILKTKENIVYRLPQIKKIHKNENGKIRFVLEKTDLFFQDALVTVCFCDENSDFEENIGIGFVEAINGKGCPQILFVPFAHKQLQDNKHDRELIKIKPSVSKRFYKEQE